VTTFLEQQQFSGNTLFIASVDFSHHVEENFAKIHDQKTLQSLKYENFENLEVDCASCLYVLKKLATNY
jgi:predicted class III extradiol MEMO1 family dioxygenase